MLLRKWFLAELVSPCRKSSELQRFNNISHGYQFVSDRGSLFVFDFNDVRSQAGDNGHELFVFPFRDCELV